ncbi:hypothetical protein [Salinispora arenicola]|uniref:hypothetical protein n=1 Tax=Salinispora arenicola TaxID=168697 RepID=UPI0027DE099A|nr:hypothetical protein [Salinispora arenicola]
MGLPSEVDLAEPDLADPDLYAEGDPDAEWAWLRAHRPVYRNPAGATAEFWALTRYRDALQVYRGPVDVLLGAGHGARRRSGGGDPAAGRMLVVTTHPGTQAPPDRQRDLCPAHDAPAGGPRTVPG